MPCLSAPTGGEKGFAVAIATGSARTSLGPTTPPWDDECPPQAATVNPAAAPTAVMQTMRLASMPSGANYTPESSPHTGVGCQWAPRRSCAQAQPNRPEGVLTAHISPAQSHLPAEDGSRLGRRWSRILPDDYGVGDLDDLVDRQVGGAGVGPDRHGVRGLVGADGAHR